MVRLFDSHRFSSGVITGLPPVFILFYKCGKFLCSKVLPAKDELYSAPELF
jgi:hypothetical protein